MKTLLQSRTFWLAIIQAVAAVLVVVFTELDMVGSVVLLKSVVDIILRVMSTEGIKGI